MKLTIKLTDKATGSPVVISAEMVKAVRDYPSGQAWIDFKDGTVLQPEEDYDQVAKWFEEALAL